MTTLTIARRRSLPTAAVSGAAAAATGALGAVLLPVGFATAYIGIATATVGVLAVVAAVIDARTRRLPNALVAPMCAIALTQAGAWSVSRGSSEPLAGAVVAAAVLGILYALMAVAGWVGVGDVKYIAALGLLVGTFVGAAAIVIAPIAVVSASLHRGAAALLRTKAPHRLPHGPTILLAAAVVIALIPIGLT